MKRIIIFALVLMLVSAFSVQVFSVDKKSETAKKTETVTEKTSVSQTTSAPKKETVTEKTSVTEKESAHETTSAPEETTVNMSAPKLMVTDYKLEKESIVPGKSSKITVTLKNTNSYKSVRNLKLTLSDATGEIVPDGMGTTFSNYIGAGEVYVWETSLSAVNTAEEGRHQLTLSAEYEDSYFSSYSSSDNIFVNVKQPVSLDFDGAVLPAKVVQDETVSLSLNLMNTGKSTLYNVKIESSVENLKTGGCVFAGEIPAGENKTTNVNFLVSPDFTGDTSGKITISYEDVYGEKYSVEQTVSTLVDEKTEIADIEEKDEKKYPLWWAFLLGGLVIGGGVGAAIPVGIYSAKQRKRDEERL